MTTSPKQRSFHLTLISTYLLLALLMTWPTVTHLTSHLPGDGGDDPAIAWNLWWIKYSLLNEPQHPFLMNAMFYPVGINLAFYTLTVLNGLTSLPLLLNFGVVTASNLQLWFSFVVGGYGAFLLAFYLLLAPPWGYSIPPSIARLSAALAGLSYAFASSKLFYVALGQFNIASTHWIPFAILFFIKIHREPRNWRWPVLAALFLVMQAWTELTYATFVVVFMGLYWLYWLLTDLSRRVIRWPYLSKMALLALLFVLGISPFLAAMLSDLRAEGDFFVVGGGFADVFSADLVGFFVPTMHHPLFGGLISQTGIHNFAKGQHVYLGYSLLVLAALGFWAHRPDPATRFWLFAGVIFALLTLGPQITINGASTGLTGPFTILQSLPFFKGNRYPSRYSTMLLLALAPLAALGFSYLAEKVGRGAKRGQGSIWLAGLLAALFLFEHLALPLPQSDMTVPAPYQLIAQDHEAVTVLDIPFGWRNGFRITGALTTGIMFGQFYQTEHQKPILHGNTSRNPEFKFQYFSDAPIIRSLIVLENGDELPPQVWEADRPYVDDVLRVFSTKYIVVRPEPPGDQHHPQATIPYIEALFPVEKLHQDPTLVLYRVDLPPALARLDLLGDPHLATLYFAEGWGLPGQSIAAQRTAVRLLTPLNGAAQSVQFRVRLPEEAPMAASQMWLSLAGWRSPKVTLTRDWQMVTIDLPAAAVSTGLNEIWLHFEQTFPVDPARMDVTVISAGEEGGNLGHIYLNGVDVSPNQRGYNVAVIDPTKGLGQVENFDTHCDPKTDLSCPAEANRRLAELIATAPQGAIVAIAAADEASDQLSDEGVNALKSIGGQVDLRGQQRASHALIAVKGKDRILEAHNPWQQPVKLTTGLGLIEPHVAAIFESIVFEAKP